MTEDSGPSCTTETSKPEPSSDNLSSQRVFKKSSPNNKLTLYLSSRDLVVSSGKIDRVQGVLLVDPEFVEQRKVYGQVTLTFRYGREDEEVMGLKFCNEAVMCLAQLYPPHAGSQPPEANTPLQDALIRRLGPNAYPFTMEITPLAPPSVQLVPAKEYSGAPIGTSYDVRAYIAERIDEKIHRRTTVRMGIRVIQRAFAPPSPYVYSPGAAIPSSKDRYKQKITLFGSQTAPMEGTEARLIKQNISNSEEVRLTMNRVYDNGNTGLNSRKPSIVPRVEKKMQDLADRVDGYIEDAILNDRTPTHIVHKDVSKENLQNDNDCEENKKNELMEANHEENIEKKEAKIERKESILSIGETTAITRIRSSCGGKRPSLAAFLAGVPPPHAMVEKPFLLSDGRIELEAQLNKGIYYHGEEIFVSISVRNSSNKSIRRIKVFVVQHVDVCMFSNGKFKNIVAVINSKDNCPISSGSTYEHTYGLVPTKSSTKNWIALEDSYTKSGTSLASSVMCSSTNPDDRNVFAIYVSYYVKVKLIVSVMGREVSIKLPFTLMHTCNEDSPIEVPRNLFQRKSVVEEVKPEKDGT